MASTEDNAALEALQVWVETQARARPRLVAAAWAKGVRNISQLSRIARTTRDTVYADLRSQGIDYRKQGHFYRPVDFLDPTAVEQATEQAVAAWGEAPRDEMTILTCVIARYACALIAHRVREAHPDAHRIDLQVADEGIFLTPAGLWADAAGSVHELSPRCHAEVSDLGEYLTLDHAETWKPLCTSGPGVHRLSIDAALTPMPAI
ncbi:hypothetical protein ACFV4E_29120 [Streptomyces hygroscopicus]|uniref:hypothetical protein n=1 Tax=Streptomyces hygroscopicus TaxID=1912 RepID=UPI000783315E|nr:hypothetical protein [Streptomyces hygroscopicus]